MNDREMLELAAKAFFGQDGFEWNSCAGFSGCVQYIPKDGRSYVDWNPLDDDGDALRLAVKLRLDISFLEGFEEITVEDYHCTYRAREDYKPDMAAATRRAIVRAAAATGQSMP